MHATGDYTIAELMEVSSISRVTVYRVLDRAGARPGAGMGAQSYETVGEVVMLKEVLADGGRALVISRAGEKRVVRLAEPLLHQPLRVGDSLLLESWSGYVYERIPKAEVEELILEEEERDKRGEATPRAPQGPEATAARTSASCVDDIDDDQGVAVVEIEAVA